MPTLQLKISPPQTPVRHQALADALTQQKTAFIDAAFAELGMQLGGQGEGPPLEPTSYVIVRELPASDWGYGGHEGQTSCE